MAEGQKQEPDAGNIRTIIREAIAEFISAEQSRAEPAHKAELLEERRRREQLEQQVNTLVEENRKSRQMADEADRSATIRSELQRLGVSKVDLAFRVVRDDIARAEDGRLVAKGANGHVALRDYLAQFVSENPELLPARMAGGSGAGMPERAPSMGGGPFDLEKIKPGMTAEELARAREEISRVAAQALRGL